MNTYDSPLPLEDTHLDILGKAQRGLQFTDAELLKRSGVTSSDFARIQSGELLSEPLALLATTLNLNPRALLDSAKISWQPKPICLPDLKTFTSDFGDMTVNAYLLWDTATKEAVAFDSGADVSPMLDWIKQHQLTLKLILITHTHGDHIFDLDRLMEKTGAPAFVGDKEPKLDGAEPFPAGKVFQVGSITLESRLTWGHAEGGITYVVKGLASPVAIVGDAIFAGSMGGGKVSYANALRTTRDEIMTLPDETIIASGHGPLTTVAEQKSANPFFAV